MASVADVLARAREEQARRDSETAGHHSTLAGFGWTLERDGPDVWRASKRLGGPFTFPASKELTGLSLKALAESVAAHETARIITNNGGQ